MIETALDLHRQGKLPEAERAYQAILARQPDQFDALHFLGVLKLQQGRPAEALQLISRAVEQRPDASDALRNLAAALSALQRHREALAACDRMLAIDPSDLEALYGRGAALSRLGSLPEALASFDKVLAIRPDHVKALFGRGNALAALRRHDEALATFERLLAADPNFIPAVHNRGNALLRLGRFEQALAAFDRVLVGFPGYVEALNSRAAALKGLGRYDDALAACEQARAVEPKRPGALIMRADILLELKRPAEALDALDEAAVLQPDNADISSNRGRALAAMGRYEEALQQYARALAINPDHVNTLIFRGNALHALDRNEEAVASYDEALKLEPDHADALCNRGMCRHLLNQWRDAVDDYERAVTLKPNHPEARLGLCTAQLPVVYASEREVAERRAAYERALNQLSQHVMHGGGNLAKGVGSSQPFFLAYQGHDDKDLQSRYGDLVCRIMQRAYPPASLPPLPAEGERVRVGIVSGFFYQHSVWKIPVKGWLGQLDRGRFQVFGYSTSPIEDPETAAAAAMCDRFHRAPRSIDAWRQAIANDAPHVLIYPEVGMDPISVQLAAQRLAPVQCNGNGHPDSSGFPTLDYVLSSDLMEPPDAERHYTERLIRLPNLSVYYEPLEIDPAPLTRTELGLRPTATVFWCGQSLYKYLPQYDEVFARIARGAGDCQLAFIQSHYGTNVTDVFRGRLERAFAAQGMEMAEHCVFWPRLDQATFSAAIGQCDVVLDSIGWSGFNTTMETLPHGLPVVTMPGKLMRGRHAMAILKMMGVTETIVDSLDAYVSTAVRLARDVLWRKSVSARMAANKHRAYRDRACIAALQDFLEQVGQGRSPT